MIRLYIPVKHNTSIKGYWQDNNKLYIDNIVIKDYIDPDIFQRDCIKLLESELTIFYVINNTAYIKDRDNNITILRHRIKIYRRHTSKMYIRDIVNKYNGCTIQKTSKGSIVYIWKV